jgi:hypothetical protein
LLLLRAVVVVAQARAQIPELVGQAFLVRVIMVETTLLSPLTRHATVVAVEALLWLVLTLSLGLPVLWVETVRLRQLPDRL